MSNEGPDPMEPLLFCNTIQPLLQSLQAELPLGYLDDLTLGGEQSVVAKDVDRVVEVRQAMGLSLNFSKCKLISNPGTIIKKFYFAATSHHTDFGGNSAWCTTVSGPGLGPVLVEAL